MDASEVEQEREAVPAWLRRRLGVPVRWLRVERRRRAVPPEGPALFVYGHSYVSGTGPAPWSWPVLVAAELGLPLVNLGKAGDRIDQTARLARPRAARPGPGDLVLLESGLNDARQRGTDEAAALAFERQLDRVLARLGRFGATVRPLADPPLTEWPSPHPRSSRGSHGAWLRYHRAVRSRPGSIDLSVGWDGPTMIGADRVHPNELGVRTLAATVLAAVALDEPGHPEVTAP